MKRKLKLMMGLLFILVTINANAQIKKGDNSFYYWFKAKVEISTDNERKRPEYKIIQVSPTLESGSQNDFSDAYKHNLENLIVTIGPFTEKDEAERSLASCEYVKTICETNDKLKKTEDSTKYFWFYSNFVSSDNKMKFERTAARINFGSISHFNQYLCEGLSFHQLCLGPFTSQYNAEIAKFYQRKIGERSQKNSKHALKKMARRVDQITIRHKTTVDSAGNLVSYKLDIDIPPRYLNKKSVLILQFQLICEFTKIMYKEGLVVQGEKVEDNNMGISDERGGMITKNIVFKVPDIKKTIIEKLLIIPTFTNYSHIVQGKGIEVTWE